MKHILICTLITLCSIVSASKIKLIEPTPGKKILLHGPMLASHARIFQGVAAALAQEGYNVSLLVANNSKLIPECLT